MVEYALINALLIGGILVSTTGTIVFFLPDMMNAFQIYLNGIYLILSLPIP